MFWALHFMKNSSIILLTSSFSVFLIFHFLFCEQLLSTEFIMERSFFLMCGIAELLSLTCHTVRQAYADSYLSVCAAKLHFSIVNSVLFATSTWPFSAWCKYSTMYCVTTNTLCTIENNVRYSALMDWLIYHIVWFRVLNFCLFCWLINFLLLQLCMYL